MHYSVTTRAKRNGIHFATHELARLGIDDGGTCWGIWVAGPGFDKLSKLYPDALAYTNESPHMAIAPLHPNLWATAFGLDVYMDRRRFAPGTDPILSDAFVGLTDALARCGVNILFVSTAQYGYDLVCFTATCDFPALRLPARTLIAVSDSAGAEIERLRQLRLPEHEFREKRLPEYQRRVRAFQHLGRLMLPRLIELESRLHVIDDRRFSLWECQQQGKDPAKCAALSNNAIASERTLIVGHEPLQAGTAGGYERSVAMPWYLNQHVAGAGENSYFLSYSSMENKVNVDDDLPQNIKEMLVASPHELNEEAQRSLYKLTLAAMLRRQPPPNMLSQIPVSSADSNNLEGISRSGTSERLLDVKNGLQYERDAYKEFFQRQALVPIRVTAMPTLAYARFSALGGMGNGRTGEALRGKPIRFRFKNNLLYPVGLDVEKHDRMRQVFRFLNNATGISEAHGDSVFEEFGQDTAVFANFHATDRFLRLRFAREQVQAKLFLTVKLRLQVEGNNDPAVSSIGLLRAASRVLAAHHLRVDGCCNQYVDGDDHTEISEWKITAKVVDDHGEAFARTLHSDDVDAAKSLGTSIAKEIQFAAGSPVDWRSLTVTIEAGVVPRRSMDDELD